jgi:hypothetical protein
MRQYKLIELISFHSNALLIGQTRAHRKYHIEGLRSTAKLLVELLEPSKIHRTEDAWAKAYAFYRRDGVSFAEASKKAQEVFYTDRDEMRRLEHEEM